MIGVLDLKILATEPSKSFSPVSGFAETISAFTTINVQESRPILG